MPRSSEPKSRAKRDGSATERQFAISIRARTGFLRNPTGRDRFFADCTQHFARRLPSAVLVAELREIESDCVNWLGSYPGDQFRQRQAGNSAGASSTLGDSAGARLRDHTHCFLNTGNSRAEFLVCANARSEGRSPKNRTRWICGGNHFEKLEEKSRAVSARRSRRLRGGTKAAKLYSTNNDPIKAGVKR